MTNILLQNNEKKMCGIPIVPIWGDEELLEEYGYDRSEIKTFLEYNKRCKNEKDCVGALNYLYGTDTVFLSAEKIPFHCSDGAESAMIMNLVTKYGIIKYKAGNPMFEKKEYITWCYNKGNKILKIVNSLDLTGIINYNEIKKRKSIGEAKKLLPMYLTLETYSKLTNYIIDFCDEKYGRNVDGVDIAHSVVIMLMCEYDISASKDLLEIL